MKTEMLNRIKFVGPWGWEMSGKEWRLCGEFPGVNGMATEMRWGDTCRALTGHDEPGEPVRVRVPVTHPLYKYRRLETPVTHGPCSEWRIYVTVPAWPIESHGLKYYVWRDSRGVLRFIERA